MDAIGTLFEDVNLTPSGIPDSVLDFWRERLKTGGFWPVTLDEKMRFQHDQPENFALMAELRALMDEYPQRLMLGETDDPRYYGNGQDGLHSLFNFSLMNISNPKADVIRKVIQARAPKIPTGAWDCNTLGNHDSRRAHSRLLEHAKDERAYIALMGLVMTLPGTPMLYYGDEIGMGEHFLNDVADFKDNLGVWAYSELREGGTSEAEALKLAQQLVSRDKCRTPMQWDVSPNAGFAPDGVATWLPVNPNYAEGVNVAAQIGVAGSILEHFRTLARLRAEYSALRRGNFQLLNATDDILAFWRREGQGAALVAINFNAEERRASLGMSRLRRAYSNYGTFYTAAELGRRPASEDLAGLKFKPYEVLVCMA